MVTTRGKTIKFDIDSSDGEQDGEIDVERPAKPAPKRRRTKKSKPDDDDGSFNPSSSSLAKGKEKATSDQNQLITRRGGKGGKLRDLMNMPVDIFAEVCSYLDPYDLRCLALTSKRLWDILMTKEARHIWKTALASVPNLPECPTDLNEPQYVCLLYSSECYSIGCTSRGTKADWFHRVRFCASCYDANMMNEWEMRYNGELDAEFESDTWHDVRNYFDSLPVMRLVNNYRRSNSRRRRGRNAERHIYISDLKKAAHEYESLPNEEKPAYLVQLKEKRDYRIETGTAMLNWKFSQLASRAEEISAGKSARFESIKAKLLELGWEEEDFPMEDKEFKDLVLKDQKLTPKIWQNIRPKLEPLLQTSRTERLEIEKNQRRWNRENAIGEYYQQIGRETMDFPFEHYRLRYLLPEVDKILELPSVKQLIEDDTETVTEDQWIEVAPDVRLVVVKWWRDSLKQLVDALEIRGTTPSPNEPHEMKAGPTSTGVQTEGMILASIDALRSQLSYATSGFYCKASWCKKVFWFPHAVKHAVLEHYKDNITEVLDQLQPLQLEGQTLVKRLLQELKFDPQTAKWSDVVAKGLPQKNYLCTRCDERVAKHMTFTELIEHYLEVQTWHDEVTKAVRDSPDSCYPSRAVNSELPKIINDHDWISGAALLVRQDDEKAKEEVLKLQAAFRKEGLNDPACDTEGIGGEDLEKNPWREVKRTCRLCPRTYAPTHCSTKKIELHVRQKHNKEPNLETDTTTEDFYTHNPCPL